MDYLKAYYNLIETRKKIKNRSGYLESHHIVPRSVFGKGILKEDHLKHVDAKDNLVELSGREHFVAHWLLYRAYPHIIQFAAAFHAMANLSGKIHQRYTPSSRAVEEARKAYADARREPVAQYDLKGNLLKVWEITEDAGKHYNIENSNISAACNPENNVNNIKGFQWRRLLNGKAIPKIEEYINQNDADSLQVHRYDHKGYYLKSYSSKREAMREGFRRFRKDDIGKPELSKGNWFIITNLPPKEKIKIKFSSTLPRPINQFNNITGELIKTWNSSREVQRELGISGTHNVANGKRKSAGGFIWKWADDNEKIDLKNYKTKLAKAKRVELFRFKKSLGVFDSIRQASDSTGITRHLIQMAIKKGEWHDITVSFIT